MEAKLRQLMKHEGINSTRLAEILGIQASGISHIMSGRNKPSFDFLLKLLQRFPQINPDWLILDKGPMYRDEIKNKNQSPAAGIRSNSQGTGGNGYTPGGITEGVTARRVAGSVGPEGMGDVVSPEIAGSGATGMTGAAGSAAGGAARMMNSGLFGPDNDDIIRSGENPGGGPGAPGRPGGSGASAAFGGHTDPQGVQTWQAPLPANHPTDRVIHSEATSRSGQGAVQPPVYQTGNLTRSASIERIVVFYKDKTFSEYRPE